MRYVAGGILVALALAGCTRAPVPLPATHGRCVSMADTVKTLRTGDELPRVVQVLGMPSRGYRAFSPFGRIYDVLEYDVTPSACYKAMLDAVDKVQVVFDGQGRYVGTGRDAARRMKRVTTVRVEPLILDPVVLLP